MESRLLSYETLMIQWHGDAEAESMADHENDPGRELRQRMLSEATLVLSPLPGGEKIVTIVEGAATGSVADLRCAIADGYEHGLRSMMSDPREVRALQGVARDRRVPPEARPEVVNDAFTSAWFIVDGFRKAEGRFSGHEPENATPAQKSFWGWMRHRVRGQATAYHRYRAKERPTEHLDAFDDPDSDLLEDQVFDKTLGLDVSGVDVRRAFLAAARDEVTESLASPDQQARKHGSDRSLQEHRALAAVAIFLVRIELEDGQEEVLASPETVVQIVDDAIRGVLLAEPGTSRDDTDRPMERGLRSDVLFISAGAIRLALMGGLGDDLSQANDHIVGDVRFGLLELLIALQIAQIKPLVLLIAHGVTTTAVGGKRVSACSEWLEELLDWLVIETSPDQQVVAVTPAVEWLEAVDNRTTSGESPIARARREVNEGGRKASEAICVIAVHERLLDILKGTHR